MLPQRPSGCRPGALLLSYAPVAVLKAPPKYFQRPIIIKVTRFGWITANLARLWNNLPALDVYFYVTTSIGLFSSLNGQWMG